MKLGSLVCKLLAATTASGSESSCPATSSRLSSVCANALLVLQHQLCVYCSAKLDSLVCTFLAATLARASVSLCLAPGHRSKQQAHLGGLLRVLYQSCMGCRMQLMCAEPRSLATGGKVRMVDGHDT